ncbi:MULTISPECIES: ParA family protein [unclassified Sphingopyxis]|jgi:cellulose biosynthesis protein BcsQ|uniref:ParA family protein n=1 Tax=unclassified Sphingopyxis TaxID=2614943 RepID=UPI0026009497|nr:MULTISPECIES: ParA family protein [unclassified Sphingopyxis]
MSKTAHVIAIYSLKGGVGKTSLAVNLAAEAALQAGGRTLLWDLDGQAASSFILGHDGPGKRTAEQVFDRDVAPSKLVTGTAIAGLDLLPADTSLRGLDALFLDAGKKKRLARLLADVGTDYDRIILDCPPGLTETSEQMMRAADLIVVPVIPSPLSRRALDEVIAHLRPAKKDSAPLLPVYAMVNARRGLHRAALAAEAAWPVLPMASIVEQMAARRKPLAAYARSSKAGKAYAALWQRVAGLLDAKRG